MSANNNAPMHEGHRERLKNRFVAEGLDHFEPHVILELILFYAVPRRDTNPIAHDLLKRFGGSLSRVFDAPLEELVKTDGVTMNSAVLIKLFPEVCRRYLLDFDVVSEVVKNSSDAARRLVPLFLGKTNEVVAIMCIDSKGKVLFCSGIFEGSVSAAQVSVRRVVEVAVRYATTDVILAHNHPSGTAIPSEQDVFITQRIAEALGTVNINLVDHIIVADHDWVSLAATPSLSDIFPAKNGFIIG
ncbi:MAG: JAB domain-containing protein [Clostridia bacterium]|nr:JAB domain-containing protein [Clostridia bacterium]